jgi:hypothetical protein
MKILKLFINSFIISLTLITFSFAQTSTSQSTAGVVLITEPAQVLAGNKVRFNYEIVNPPDGATMELAVFANKFPEGKYQLVSRYPIDSTVGREVDLSVPQTSFPRKGTIVFTTAVAPQLLPIEGPAVMWVYNKENQVIASSKYMTRIATDADLGKVKILSLSGNELSISYSNLVNNSFIRLIGVSAPSVPLPLDVFDVNAQLVNYTNNGISQLVLTSTSTGLTGETKLVLPNSFPAGSYVLEVSSLSDGSVTYLRSLPFRLIPQTPDLSTTTTISVVKPNGGEQWEIDTLNTVTWSPYGYNPDINAARDVTAYLEKKEHNGSFTTLGKIQETGAASIHWYVGQLDPFESPGKKAPTGQYYVRLVNNLTGATDRSDKPFRIVAKSVDLKINGQDGPAFGGKFVYVSTSSPVRVSWSVKNNNNCYLNGLGPTPGLSFLEVHSIPITSRNGVKNMYPLIVPANEYYSGGILNSVSLYCTNSSSTGVSTSDYVQIDLKQPTDESRVKITSPNGGEVLEVASTTKITWEAQGVGMTSIALYENDKWAAWIAKDVFVGDTGEFCGTRGICEYSWNPSSPTVTYGLGDKLNKPIFKIYITGTKANGTGYVEDKSDRPFRFKDTPVFEAPVLKVSPETQAIEKGKSTKIFITTENIKSCKVYGGVFKGNVFPLNSSRTVNPRISTTYEITCMGKNGTTVKGTAFVEVVPVSTGTTTISTTTSFYFDPLGSSLSGDTSFLGGTLPTEGVSITAMCPKLFQNLEKGSTDNGSMGEVTKLQKFLAQRYGVPDAGFVTGYFGDVTKAYLMRFQDENGLPATGYLGSFTRKKVATCE